MISVIVPCYNHGKYIPDLLSSIYGGESSLGVLKPQTLLPAEVIIVDDNSDDNTANIIKEQSQLYNEEESLKVHYIKNLRTFGTAISCNIAIDKAKYEVITRIDADDMRAEESFERMYRELLEHEEVFVYDNIRLLTPNGLQDKIWELAEYDFYKLKCKNTIHSGIMFWKTSWVKCKGYPDEMANGRDDWAFNVALGLNNIPGVKIDYPGYIYRRFGQNRSLKNNSSEWQMKYAKQMEKVFPDLYGGDYMACCGGRNRAMATPSVKGVGSEQLVGASGMILIEYQGGNFGSETYFGPVTGVAYRFSAKRRQGFVDKRDVWTENKQGLLQLHDRGKQVFIQKQVQEPVPAPAEKVVEVEPASDIVPELFDDFTQLKGVGKSKAQTLRKAGIHTFEQFRDTPEENLAELLNITLDKVPALVEDSFDYSE